MVGYSLCIFAYFIHTTAPYAYLNAAFPGGRAHFPKLQLVKPGA